MTGPSQLALAAWWAKALVGGGVGRGVSVFISSVPHNNGLACPVQNHRFGTMVRLRQQTDIDSDSMLERQNDLAFTLRSVQQHQVAQPGDVFFAANRVVVGDAQARYSSKSEMEIFLNDFRLRHAQSHQFL